MATRLRRYGARSLVVATATATIGVLAAAPASAVHQSGEGTVLELTLGITLFGNLPGVPPQVIPVLDDDMDGSNGLQPIVVGSASYNPPVPGEEFDMLSIPDNPLLTAEAITVRATAEGTGAAEVLTVDATVAGLNLAGAQVAEAITAVCTAGPLTQGGPPNVTADSVIATASGDLLNGRVGDDPATLPIPGLGSVTVNQVTVDGDDFPASSSAETIDIVIDTELDPAALRAIPGVLPAYDAFIRGIVQDLINAAPPEVQLLAQPLFDAAAPLSGDALATALGPVLALIPDAPAGLPALDDIADVTGSISVANAFCTQRALPAATPAPTPTPTTPGGPGGGGGTAKPPLADTGPGDSAVLAGLAGLMALTAGGAMVARRRRLEN